MKTELSVFEQSDYKTFLTAWLKRGGRGEGTRVANALRCQLAYISQVTRGSSHLSPEQADAFSRYANFSEEESDYFLLMVSLARAGTESLRRVYERKMAEVQSRRRVLSQRLSYQKPLNREAQATYYSQWIHSAVHLALTVPSLGTSRAIAEYLGEPESIVKASIEFLVSVGLARRGPKRSLEATHASVHAGNDTSFAALHHVHWRLRAIDSLRKEGPDELHYSSIVSMSLRDLESARRIWVTAIEEMRALVKSSPPEELICYSTDLFAIGNRAVR